METGRNDPCPCGSGLKYKKCCASPETPILVEPATRATAANMEFFGLNRQIAYKGKIGRAREDFCIRYIARKQAFLKEIELDQEEKTASAGEMITCHKGCANCCTQYILGTLQECEAIVYYLYQNKNALADFMTAYPVWRNKLRQYDTAFQAVKDAVNRQISEGVNEANTLAYEVANVRFMMLNLKCPFQNKTQECSIHEVRPWNCAKPVATTPSEWCHPFTNKKNDLPNVYMSEKVPEELPYFLPTKSLNVMLVHLGVWQILTEGFYWLSDIPGLEDMAKETMQDPEVQETVGRYLPA